MRQRVWRAHSIIGAGSTKICIYKRRFHNTACGDFSRTWCCLLPDATHE